MSQQHTLWSQIKPISYWLRYVYGQQIMQSYYPSLLSAGKTAAAVMCPGCSSTVQEGCWGVGVGSVAGHPGSWNLKELQGRVEGAGFVLCSLWGREGSNCSPPLPEGELKNWGEKFFRGYNQGQQPPTAGGCSGWDIQTEHQQKLLH